MMRIVRDARCRHSGQEHGGFLALVLALIERNGLAMSDIHVQRRMLTLPCYFRPTKLWDMLVMYRGQLVAALEFKYKVGPSFGNNFNNCAEEAIGTAHDLWTAYREGALGEDSPRR
ncbi:PaeR7I family type II restriction endonuclease [Pseudogemmobacter humi]|uniref:Type-2 restriction enzyme PaeR7I n=1 Tax=Pseudogemmobacter humi TaxID=2483812 RepID=A0A3P5WK27_9RHOB|nr:PaeR7I family type II restriction endonuclease [Pseudogemmobacter humi]VDC18938.1 Type-2 restriction enzyme PaeR7I [Pseudogemmobacter humi]